MQVNLLCNGVTGLGGYHCITLFVNALRPLRLKYFMTTRAYFISLLSLFWQGKIKRVGQLKKKRHTVVRINQKINKRNKQLIKQRNKQIDRQIDKLQKQCVTSHANGPRH